MKSYQVIFFASVFALQGCVLVERLQPKSPDENSVVASSVPEEVCLLQQLDGEAEVEQNCNLIYWLNFWVEQDKVSWPNRREQINQLGEGVTDTLKKVLLSQIRGTPYQARLRAQGWADELLPKLTPAMQDMLRVMVYKPSQEMLEFESALTILTRINTSQSKEIDAQQQRLKEQQQQIEQLLKIEASMMEKREGISQ